jgi:hypothetical protein
LPDSKLSEKIGFDCAVRDEAHTAVMMTMLKTCCIIGYLSASLSRERFVAIAARAGVDADAVGGEAPNIVTY